MNGAPRSCTATMSAVPPERRIDRRRISADSQRNGGRGEFRTQLADRRPRTATNGTSDWRKRLLLRRLSAYAPGRRSRPERREPRTVDRLHQLVILRQLIGVEHRSADLFSRYPSSSTASRSGARPARAPPPPRARSWRSPPRNRPRGCPRRRAHRAPASSETSAISRSHPARPDGIGSNRHRPRSASAAPCRRPADTFAEADSSNVQDRAAPRDRHIGIIQVCAAARRDAERPVASLGHADAVCARRRPSPPAHRSGP